MKKQIYLLVGMMILIGINVSLIKADEQIYQVCGGDNQLQILCQGDNQYSTIGHITQGSNGNNGGEGGGNNQQNNSNPKNNLTIGNNSNYQSFLGNKLNPDYVIINYPKLWNINSTNEILISVYSLNGSIYNPISINFTSDSKLISLTNEGFIKSGNKYLVKINSNIEKGNHIIKITIKDQRILQSKLNFKVKNSQVEISEASSNYLWIYIVIAVVILIILLIIFDILRRRNKR